MELAVRLPWAGALPCAIACRPSLGRRVLAPHLHICTRFVCDTTPLVVPRAPAARLISASRLAVSSLSSSLFFSVKRSAEVAFWSTLPGRSSSRSCPCASVAADGHCFCSGCVMQTRSRAEGTSRQRAVWYSRQPWDKRDACLPPVFSLANKRRKTRKERNKERGCKTLYQPRMRRNNTAALSPQQSRADRITECKTFPDTRFEHIKIGPGDFCTVPCTTVRGPGPPVCLDASSGSPSRHERHATSAAANARPPPVVNSPLRHPIMFCGRQCGAYEVETETFRACLIWVRRLCAGSRANWTPSADQACLPRIFVTREQSAKVQRPFIGSKNREGKSPVRLLPNLTETRFVMERKKPRDMVLPVA